MSEETVGSITFCRWADAPGNLIPMARSIIAFAYFKAFPNSLDAALSIATDYTGKVMEQALVLDPLSPSKVDLTFRLIVPEQGFQLPTRYQAMAIAEDPEFALFIANRVKPRMNWEARARDYRTTPATLSHVVFRLLQRVQALENAVLGLNQPVPGSQTEMFRFLEADLDANPMRE